MNNIVRDALVDIVIEQLEMVGLTEKLSLSDIRNIADELILEDCFIKDIPDTVLTKIKKVIESKEQWIHCDNCGDKIEIGNTMYQIGSNYVCSVQCVLEFNNVSETILEECFFGVEEE